MKIKYIARCEQSKLPGVFNKINQTVLALCLLGHDAEMECIKIHPTNKSIVEMIKSILASKDELLIVRFDMSFAFFLPAILIKRFQGVKVNVDIPTPIATGLKEIQR